MHPDWDSFLPYITPALLLAAIGLCINIYYAQRSHSRAIKTEQARIYFTISERWTAVLQLLYTVRRAPPPDIEDLKAQHGSIKSFMESDAWRSVYRPVCNFFEDIGFIVYNDNLPISAVRVIVTISQDDYLLLKPVLDWIRSDYRADIYEFWNYLLWKAQVTQPVRPFKNKARYEPRPPLND